MYEPQEGTWTLTAPDGRQWTGASGLMAAAAEQRERIPASVQLERIFAAVDEDSCEWSQDDDGNWTTECGGMFVISEGTPKDNDMSFCCYCGEPLKTANEQAQGAGGGLIAGGSPGAAGSTAGSTED